MTIFYTPLEKENDAGEIEQIPMLKTFTVFNVQKIDDLPLITETVCISPWNKKLPGLAAIPPSRVRSL
ncbi:hypothetical protein PEC106568_43130 [Pectobacterium carotovorum subsp. carotovorum]|nr:hypothetical protein PEC106568_43130 [Pectobacterium carotovorum subsp. carotovorum]